MGIFLTYFDINSVCAVIVTYFPDCEFEQRLQRIARQVKRVIIVDNGSTGSESLVLDAALKRIKNVELIKNRANLGIATALNQGVRKSLDYGFLWVITFDQDSLIAPDTIRKMFKVWETCPRPEKLMVVGCKTIFLNCFSNLSSIQTDKPWEEVTYVITSGCLISRKAFDFVGYFNNSLFIDYVDIEYCLRLKSKGYRIIIARDAILFHNIGNLVEHTVLGKNVHPTHHDPIRRYYQFRNALLLHKIYRKKDPAWCNRNRLILIKIICLILLYERKRLRKMFQIVKGIWHGISGRAGQRGEIPFVCADTI